MKKCLVVSILCCAVIVASVSASMAAIPSFRGYTGLIKIPSADTLNLGQWNVGVMTENVTEFAANDIFANYGIADNLEIGFNAFQRFGTTIERDDDHSRTTILNAKYAFMPETCAKPGIAVGITDITNGIDTTPYLILSKSIGQNLRVWNGEITNFRGHLGIGGGQFHGVFVGFSAFLGNRINPMFEWDSRDLNVGIRFAPIEDLRIHAAFFDLTGSADFGLGASYSRVY